MTSPGRLLFGTDEPAEPATTLRAGPLEMTLQRGKLRHIRYGEHEVWEGVAFVFRDPDWGTPEPVIERIDIALRGDGFRVRIEGHFPVAAPIALRIEIEGSDQGELVFRAEAVPSGDIDCNRIGLCLLHPMALAGAPIELEHVDGRSSHSTFPRLIAPWPPFMSIRAVRHRWAPGCWARCVLDGDSFELEDQRNNSDASFKTYSRSNLMPRPYRLVGAVPIRHEARLRVESFPALEDRHCSAPVRIAIGEPLAELPRIGLEITAADADSSAPVLAALRALHPAHLHLALDPGDPARIHWAGVRTLLAAAGCGLRLDLALADAMRPAAPLQALRDALAAAGLWPESIAVFPSDARAVAAAREAFPSAAIGGGTPHYFAQLNRTEQLGPVDFISFTTSPLVHGADDEPVMLSLQSLPSMVRTLRSLYPALPVRVGPSGIGVRRSPLGGQPASDGTRRLALARHDPRCRGLFGAAWVLGYAAQFASAGAQALTLMSLQGPSGVLEGPAADAEPVPHPAYFVLSRLGAPGRVRRVSVSAPGRVAALALDRGGAQELLLANLLSEPLQVRISNWPASSVQTLNAENGGPPGWRLATDAPADPLLALPPHGMACLKAALSR